MNTLDFYILVKAVKDILFKAKWCAFNSPPDS